MSLESASVISTCQSAEQRSRESTPLLETNRSNFNYIYVFALLFILLVGVSTGSYLLFKEKGWDRFGHSKETVQMAARTVHLINSVNNNLHNISENINFGINKTGNVNEYLGWDYRCDICDTKIIRISISDDNLKIAAKALLELLNSGVKAKKLEDCFSVLVEINNDKLLRIANEIKQRNGCLLINKISFK